MDSEQNGNSIFRKLFFEAIFKRTPMLLFHWLTIRPIKFLHPEIERAR